MAPAVQVSFVPPARCGGGDPGAGIARTVTKEKQRVADEVLERIADRLPEIAGRVRMIDVATPLTFWRYARSWRGAYEGWLPTPKTLRALVPKRFPMIEGLHLVGQWVQPGGGVPPTLLSGRHLVQLLCDQAGRRFESRASA